MKNRKLIAKSNLKKSLYLGGGMAAFTAAIGLAVSIPVYNKIKAELAQSTSKLKDLSGLMSQLTNKLGIPQGASFQKELEGGYEVVYEDGQTRIYKNTGEGKSLIVNMNGDGTVGSAAIGNGPAAQAMLGVIQNAKDSMQDDQEAMADIIGPFANQAEDTSLSTEAAITGESVATLAQRNALSAGDNAEAIAAAQARLDALIKRNAEIDQAKLDAAKDRAEALKIEAEKEKQEAEELAKLKAAGDLKKIQEAENDRANAALQSVKDYVSYLDINSPTQKLKDDIDQEMNKNIKVPTSSDEPDMSDPAIQTNISLDKNEIITFANMLTGWGDVIGVKPPKSADPLSVLKDYIGKIRSFLESKCTAVNTNDEKNNLKREFQEMKIKAAKAKLDEIAKEAAIALEEARKAATERTTDHQMTKAADAGHVTPAIVKLASSLPNAINALMSAEYGYMKEGTFKKASPSVHKLIGDAMKEQGVSDSTLTIIENKIIAPLHNEAIDSSGKPTTVAFTEAVNTFRLKEQSVSRLLVLKATYINKDDKEISQLFLANQTTKSPLDFETNGDVLQSVKSINDDGTPNPMYTAANYLVMAINKNINSSITKDATIALKDVVDKGINGALKGIKNPAVFNELVKVAKVIDPENKPIQEKALVEILLSLAKKYLFEGKDVKVDGQQIINLVNNALKYDGTQEPTVTLDATKQDTPIQYGPLLTKITAKLNDPAFIDYIGYTKGAAPLIGFVDPKMIGISEVEDMLKDPDIINKIPNLKNLASSDEGKSIIENHWKTALDIVDNADVNGILKVITEPKFASIMADFNKVSELLSKVKTPVTWEMIYNHFTQLFGLNTDNPDSVKDLSKDTAWAATLQILVSDKPDVTQALKDTLKYASVKGIDLEDPKTIAQINAASDVNAQLATSGVSRDDAQEIGNQMQNVIANPNPSERLTPEEFGWVTEYTKTVFTVFGSDKVGAVAQLKKVLGDTGALKANAQKIKTFNEWIKDMQAKRLTISRSSIEKYVWTKKIVYQTLDKNGVAGTNPASIVSAVYTGKDQGDRTFIIDHISSGADGRFAVEVKTKPDGTPYIEGIKNISPTDVPKINAPHYISGQAIDPIKHLIYWVDYSTPDKLFSLNYISGDFVEIKLKGKDVGTDGKLTNNIRGITLLDGKIYAPAEGKPVVYQISLDGTVEKLSDKWSGFKSTIGTSKSGWSVGGFTFNDGSKDHNYIITPVSVDTHTKSAPDSDGNTHEVMSVSLIITNVDSGRTVSIDINDDFDTTDIGNPAYNIVSILSGKYNPNTKVQTIFVVDIFGEVTKYDLDMNNPDAPKLVPGSTIVLIKKGDEDKDGNPLTHGSTRGAVYNGEFKIFNGENSEYHITTIADSSTDLADIFKFLMEH